MSRNTITLKGNTICDGSMKVADIIERDGKYAISVNMPIENFILESYSPKRHVVSLDTYRETVLASNLNDNGVMRINSLESYDSVADAAESFAIGSNRELVVE